MPKKSTGSFAVYGAGVSGDILTVSFRGQLLCQYKLVGRLQDPWNTEFLTNSIRDRMIAAKLPHKDVLVVQSQMPHTSECGTFDTLKPRSYISLAASMLEEIMEKIIVAAKQ
jgi:hypothetical protein